MVLSPPVQAGERPRARSPFPSPHLPPYLPPHLPPAAAALALLGPRACRWPLGETAKAGFAFCGAPLLPRGSYCAAHARAARAGTSRREGIRESVRGVPA